jgi:hypothetical protein
MKRKFKEEQLLAKGINLDSGVVRKPSNRNLKLERGNYPFMQG